MERVVAVRQCPKILVTGTHSTGKTTLMTALLAELDLADARVVPELARNCPFSLNRDQNTLSTIWLVAAQVKAEIEEQTHAGASLVVCDRGIPDILAHHQVAATDSRAVWQALAADWLPTYDAIFLARPDPSRDMAWDDLRLDAPEFRTSVQQEIERCLCDAGVRYDVLPHGLEDRVACIRAQLAQRVGLS